MTLVAEAEAYRMGAGVPLKVTLVVASVVATLPEEGTLAAARGDGPIVPPVISTTSPGATGPPAPLAPFMMPVIAAGGARLANNPWVRVSPFEIPAVKYRVLRSPPLPPFPKTIAHTPWFTTFLPVTSCKAPRRFPVAGSNALITPLPKLPTSTAPPNAPQFAGAKATPQGEFRTPFETSRFWRVPLKSKTLTNPLPGPATSSFLAGSCFAYVTYRLPLTFHTLKGANPLGMAESAKPPGTA